MLNTIFELLSRLPAWLVVAAFLGIIYLMWHGAVLAVGSLTGVADAAAQSSLFKAKAVLTPNETEFYGRLRKSLPQYEVLPQVAMGAILDVALPEGHPDYWAIRQLFSQKICDFLVCERGSLRLLAVVELDDRTHNAAKDAHRDALLAQAGIRTIRWDSRRKPTREKIAETFQLLSATPLANHG